MVEVLVETKPKQFIGKASVFLVHELTKFSKFSDIFGLQLSQAADNKKVALHGYIQTHWKTAPLSLVLAHPRLSAPIYTFLALVWCFRTLFIVVYSVTSDTSGVYYYTRVV
jgi:hypothetical protein